MQRTVSFVSLIVAISYSVFILAHSVNISIEDVETVAVTVSDNGNEFFPDYDKNLGLITTLLSKKILLFSAVVGSILLASTPTWYFIKRLLSLTPVFYGADYLTNQPSVKNVV